MIDTKALREKILDLAIRGKLVPQDPNDEPASVLLERIRAQKQQMVKEGKLKAKDIKNDTVIFKGEDNLHYEQFRDGTVKCIEDEIPFELPEGWAWTRLGVICPYGTCEKVETKDIADSEWILDLEDIEKDTGLILKHITKKHRSAVSTKHRFSQGQLLYSKLRPYLNKVVIADQDGYCTSEILPLDFWGGISPLYMQIYLMSTTFLSYVNMISYGVKMPRLGTKDGERVPIALPPLQQQVMIAKKTRECLQILLFLKTEKDNLKNLIEIAKSKILNLAIRGKLVPQDPNDEPASVLLERIRAEKEELVKQGKIKRDKKESVIFKGEDNSYYQDLPENWEITTLRKITTPLTLNDGDWILSENMSPNGEVKLLQLGSIGNMVYIDKGFKYLSKQTFDELSCTTIFPKYLLINRIISDKMCCCIIPNIEGTIITTVDTCWIAPCSHVYNLKFLMYQLASPVFQSMVLIKATGTTRKRISKSNLIDLPLLFPPLVEQNRIVEAIETAFAQLDEIANSIA